MSAFAAEWIKLRTLRSTRWPLGLTVVVAGGMAYLIGISFAHANPATLRYDAMFASFYSLSFAQLALVVFAVIAVSGEYGSGTIRPSLAAVPRRTAFYLAKMGAVALCLAGAAALSVAVSFAAAQAGLGARLRTSPSADGVAGTIAGAWLYLVLIALFAAGVAQALRSTALALGVLLPVFFLGSQGVGNIPGVRRVAQFLPDQAGVTILHFFGNPDSPDYDRAYGPWGGLGILALWAAAALAAGLLTLRRRDA
ncbi:ABC transporter permease [Dactylosporangium darangshiense]|uniref:ABC transporter permease subunit n=1 Tax=Dactylosporangium darangshiense TaxID=579108 RepID=A0ABP8D6Y9_9ACTN